MSKKLVYDYQVPLYADSFSGENLDNFISSIRERVSNTIKVHGLENKMIDYHYDENYGIYINVFREETDKEYKNRLLVEEKKIKRERAEKERRKILYENLKKEFGE